MAQPTVSYPAEGVSIVRREMHYQLEQVFKKAGGLATECREGQRHPKELSAELAAVLAELGDIIANLDRLGWDPPDVESAVTLEVNDAVRQMTAARRRPEGGDA